MGLQSLENIEDGYYFKIYNDVVDLIVRQRIFYKEGNSFEEIKEITEDLEIDLMDKAPAFYGMFLARKNKKSRNIRFEIAKRLEEIDLILISGYIDRNDKDSLLEYINSNGCYIQYIPNPCEEFQLSAIRENILSILLIKNPTQEVRNELAKLIFTQKDIV